LTGTWLSSVFLARFHRPVVWILASMGEGIQWSIFAINLHPIPCPSSTLQNPQSSTPDGVNP
ncbi:hypothetical protein M9458_034959, partial [Cirrhinus mrigala]